MKPIRVLHLGLHTNQGGIESIVHSWWKNIPQNSVQFDFVNVWDSPIAFEEEFIHGGCKILHKSLRKDNPGKSYEELKKIICEGNYDYVHCHCMSLSEPEPVEIVDKYTDSKVVLHSHTVVGRNTMDLRRKLIHMYGKFKLRKYPYLKLACGQEAGRAMFGNDDFTVIENGIDREEFKYSDLYRQEIRTKYGISPDTFVIGHVGRPGRPKNYPFLLETFEKFVRDNDAKLLLIGDITSDPEVQGLIKKLNICDSVICTGKVLNVYKYYSAMDVFFFPSIYEGFSVSLVEAQSTGLPCIVSNSVAKESAVSDLVTFASIDDPCEAIKCLNNYNRHRKNDRENVQFNENYDIKNSSKKLYGFYLENLN